MIHWIMLNIVCSFMGTAFYSILFSVPRRFWISCGMTGMAGFLVYQAARNSVSVATASFAGALAVVLISRVLAVRKKCPITIFLVSGIFPLVPGAGVYYTAYYLVTNQLALAANKGLESIKIAFAIVLGIAFILPIPRELFQLEYWKQRRLRVRRLRKG